ncbi:MAG: ABC transporter substrate-binding protein, partial [SAR324 cluster bacterium]|nr:ABC transporter substrate-binding protein [SAR324 cluster bacterium]
VLVNTDRTYSTGLAEFFIQSFEQHGGKILWKGEFLIDVSNYEELLQKTKPLNPDIIYLPGDYRDSSQVIGQARKMGITAIFLGGDAYGVRMYDYIGNLIDGTYYTTHWHRDAPDTASRTFVGKYETKNGLVKQTTVPLTYDSVMILAQAIREAKSLDRKKIRDALAITQYRGITGLITFDENRNPVKPAVILKLEKGDAVYIKTVSP